MAVKLRLMRIGRRNQPYYRIVAVDSRNKRDGAFIENIGQYRPLTRPSEVVVDDQKALKWLNLGAEPTQTVRNLLSRKGIMMAFHLQKKGLKEDEIWDQVSRFRLELEQKLQAKVDAEKADQEKARTAAAKASSPVEPPAKKKPVEEEKTTVAEEKVETNAEEIGETSPPAETIEEEKKSEVTASDKESEQETEANKTEETEEQKPMEETDENPPEEKS